MGSRERALVLLITFAMIAAVGCARPELDRRQQRLPHAATPENGKIPNPCPPEVGLRMAKLWDAIKASAAQDGVPVQC